MIPCLLFSGAAAPDPVPQQYMGINRQAGNRSCGVERALNRVHAGAPWVRIGGVVERSVRGHRSMLSESGGSDAIATIRSE